MASTKAEPDEVPLLDLSATSPSSSPAPRIATTTLSVGGMTCGACTSSLESCFSDLPGIVSFTVSLMTERAIVVHDLSIISVEAVAEVIEDAGFDAEVVDSEVKQEKTETGKEMVDGKKWTRTEVAVGGMTCGACTSAVQGCFEGLEGVREFEVSLITERAVCVHDEGVLTKEGVVEMIEDAGFDATLVSSEPVASKAVSGEKKLDTVVFKIFGLPPAPDDVEIVERMEAALRGEVGITEVGFNPMNSRLKLEYAPGITGVRKIVEKIEELNLNAIMADMEDNNAQLESLAKTKEIQEWKNAFKFSLAFAIPVFFLSMVFPMVWMDAAKKTMGREVLGIRGLFWGDVVCCALTVPVQFGVGKRFYRSAWKSLKHKSATMDVLVVLGTSAAFFFSVIAMLISMILEPHNRPETVFDTSTMLITFITLGRYLENSAKGQTSKALSRLMSLTPSMATIYEDPEKADTEEGVEKVIPTELIQVDDIVILRPGDKIPADGTVISGTSFIDESMVTGEAMPIQKKLGDNLIGGTVNGTGRLNFRVTRAGRDTQLAHIVKLVQQAQTSRAPIQLMADYVAGYFVPGVLTLGITTFVTWMILSHVLTNPPAIFLREHAGGRFMVCLKLCISVIVFACPCALGLSTPTAMMVGTGVGAENGILIKGGAALETATRVTHIIFDKTGTLTMGKMTVSSHALSGEWSNPSPRDEKIFWTLIGAAESSSEHPIARAIANFAREKLSLPPGAPFDASIISFTSTTGRGITATITTPSATTPFTLHLGNSLHLADNSIPLPPHPPAAPETTILISINSVPSGYLLLSDPIKPDAALTISCLRRLQITPYLCTGDSLPPALSVARTLSIPEANITASATPPQKLALISDIRASHPTAVIAMVGDGINDSPALAAADLGIALASGTDVAMEAADVVLMKEGQVSDVVAALELCGAVLRRVKLNLVWATMYNLVGLPVAMGVGLPWGVMVGPMWAGGAMAGSSVSVVVSSLMLRYWKRPDWMVLEGDEKEMKVKEPNFFRKIIGLFSGSTEKRPERNGYALVQAEEV